jgi:hypothetical protein
MIKVIVAIVIVLFILGGASIGILYYMNSKKTNNNSSNEGSNTSGTNTGNTNTGNTNTGNTNTGNTNTGTTDTGNTGTTGTIQVTPSLPPPPIIPDGVYRIKSKYSVDTCGSAAYLKWRYCSHTAKHQTTVSAFEENTTKWIFNLVEGNDIYTIKTNRGPQDGCYIYLGDYISTAKIVEQPQKYKISLVNCAYHIMNIESGGYLRMKMCSSFDPMFGTAIANSLWYLEPV